MVFESLQLQSFLQLLLAAFLGGLIGLEREYKKKEAGLKTFTLVSLGACFFTILGVHFTLPEAGFGVFTQVDPTRIIQAVAVGIGFIGGGLIFVRQSHIEGLTTAAGLWVTAAIGIAAGLKLYFLAILGSLLVVLILAGFRLLEQKILKKYGG